jgi:hypothetical protein
MAKGEQGRKGPAGSTNPLDNIDWDAAIQGGWRETVSDIQQQGSGGLPNVLDVLAKQTEVKPDYYATLSSWAEYKLGEQFWSKQQEIAGSLQENRYTAVHSCHGIGKSFIGSRAIANWIDAHEEGDAFVVTTAPTAAQVSAILWRETQKAHKKGKLSGNIVTAGYPQWKLDGELVGYGRKPADYSDSAFQGIHAPYVLVVIDEAAGVPEKLFNAVDALATNKNARVLAIGNPDDPTSYFARICRPNSGWNVIRVDGLRSPNITRAEVRALVEKGECLQCRLSGRVTPLLEDLLEEEGIEYSTEAVSDRLRDSLISPLWIEERLHRWVGTPSEGNSISKLSQQSSLFVAKVRGLFPESNTDGVIPLGWVEAAIRRWHDWNEQGRRFEGNPRRVIGADIARSGDDQTAIAIRRGFVVEELRGHHWADTMETTGHLTALLRDPQDIAVVDVIGVGAGVLDRMRENEQNVLPFNASAAAKDGRGNPLKDRSREFTFLNLRAAAWWNLREMLDPSRGFEIALPDSDSLRADLTAPKWTVRSGGAIQIEAKDDLKKRLGRSPDEADAIVQAFWTDSESAEFYTQSSGAVSWWSDLGVGEEPEANRWIPADGVEQWLNEKEIQLREDGRYGGSGSASQGFGRGGHYGSFGR